MRFTRFLAATLALGFLVVSQAQAHFGMVIPSSGTVDQHSREIDVTLSFSHPFEGIGMELAKPKQFFMVNDGKKTDLLDKLQPATVMEKTAWQIHQKVARPGVYHYVMEPTPYWEPAEDVSIIHYTKTIVAAYGADQGWDQPVGMETEILPMLRPFGNYAGNTFTGQVLLHGKPAADCEVEVELYNQDNLKAASDYHITQVVKTDGNGIFSFTCPLAGWWGFAALSEADYTLKDPEGADKGVEIGAVLWLYFDEAPKAN